MLKKYKRLNNKGFGHVELTFVIVFVIAIFGAWYLAFSHADNPAAKPSLNFQALAETSTSILLTWNQLPGANHYVIDRGGKQIASTSGSIYLDQNLKPNDFYNYKITAIDSSDATVASDSQAESPEVNNNAQGLQGYTLAATRSHLNYNVGVCTKIGAYPKPPNGAMGYSDWYFDSGDIHELDATVTIHNNPGTNSDLFLQIYNANIDRNNVYFGLQTDGTLIFSAFGTTDISRIVTGPGSVAVSGTNEGNFISLRHVLPSGLLTGTYTVSIVRSGSKGSFDWFGFSVDLPSGQSLYVGRILMPRVDPSVPASFQNGGSTWIEDYANNNNKTLYPVSNWSTDISLAANQTINPLNAYISYSQMPDSVIRPVGGAPQSGINFLVGPQIGERCVQAGYLWN